MQPKYLPCPEAGTLGRIPSPLAPPSPWEEQVGRVTELLKAWSNAPKNVFIDSVAGTS